MSSYKSKDEIEHAAIVVIREILDRENESTLTFDDKGIKMTGSRRDPLAWIAGVLDLVDELTKEEDNGA